jgi:hypothetical protein
MNYTTTIQISNATTTTYTLSNLAANTYYFTIASYNTDGTESSLASEVSTTIN